MDYISNGDIEKYGQKLNNYDFRWNKEDRLFHLVEEVGELSEIYLQYSGKKNPKKDILDVKNALSDIFEDILALAILFEIDINEIIDIGLKD